MFVRHLKKFNNQAELEAALAAGTIASPYVAIDASDNVANMVMPSDQEPADIEYTQEEEPTPVPAGPITISDYGVRSMFTSDINKWADLKFTADVELPEGSDGSDIYMAGAPENVRFAFIRKDFFNYACENYYDDNPKSASDAEQVDNTGKVIGHLLNGELTPYLPNFDEDYPDGFNNISFQPTNYSETSEEDMPFESSAILRRAPLPEEIFPYTVYCWSDSDDEFTAPVPLTTLDSSANPNMYTWIIVAGYTMGYDDKGIGYYVSSDGEYCYKLNEFVIPPAQSLIRMTSPITPEYYVDDQAYLAERLKFDASANTLTNAYVQETWGDESTMINVGNSTGIKYMFINQNIYENAKYNETGEVMPADDTTARLILSNFLNGAYDGGCEWGVITDASGGFISNASDSDENKMLLPVSRDDAENTTTEYTYYLIAGYVFDDNGDGVIYPDYTYVLGTFTQHYYETSDASLLGFYGNIYLDTQNVDENEIEGYNVNVDGTQNALYDRFEIGIYSAAAFETAYQESGTSDSSIEYLTTFRDNGNMLEYGLTGVGDGEGFNWSESGCYWNLYGSEGIILNDEDLSELIPNYNEGDDLCVAAWWVDASGNLTDAEFLATTAEDEPSDSSVDSVRLGAITPSYEQDDNHDTYGLLKASLTFDIQADEIENANMAYGIYGWPFIYFINKSDFDSHYNGYLSENPGTTFADYVYLIVQGEESVNYFSASTDAEVPYEPTDGWVDSSVSYYSDSTTVPPEYDAYYENSCTHYVVAMYTDGQWNILDPASYPDAFVDLGTYTVQPHTIDSSLEADLVTGRGTINGETIEGTTYYNTRHQDFTVTATPNTVFDRVVCGVYSSAYYNVLYDNYINESYSEEQARDLALSGMCTQVNVLDSTTSSPNVDSSMELVDNVNCNVDYTGYDDMLYLSGYFYSSQDNNLRTDWIDFTYLDLPQAPDSSQGGDSSQGDGTSSTASIYEFVHDSQNDWTDENYNTHEHYYPVIDMFNNDASINYFQCGYYDVAEEENPWSSIEDLYETYAQTYVELTQIFDGSTNAIWNASDYLGFDTTSGTVYKFVGRYVNATYSQTTDEWDNPIDLYTVNSAKPWIELGQHPEPGPEVIYGSFNDNWNGSGTFEAYLNGPAADDNYYYKAGCTSNHDWNQLMEQEQNMADWDAYVQSCLDSSVYTGTEDNPDTVTVYYSNSEDDGDVVVALFDSSDNYINYATVGNWSTISM